jgi:hypothetical protein
MARPNRVKCSTDTPMVSSAGAIGTDGVIWMAVGVDPDADIGIVAAADTSNDAVACVCTELDMGATDIDNNAVLDTDAEGRAVQPLTETVGATLALSWVVTEAIGAGVLVAGTVVGGVLAAPTAADVLLGGGIATPAVVEVRGGSVARIGGSKVPPRVADVSPNDEVNGGGGVISVLLRRRPGRCAAAVSSKSSFNGTEGLPTTVMVRRRGATMVGAGNAVRAPLRAGITVVTADESAISFATLRAADA